MAVKSYWPNRKKSRLRAANRDFGRRHFGNPLFRSSVSRGSSWHQRQQQGRTWHFPWRATLMVMAVVAVGGAAWYLLWGDHFRVRAVEVKVEGASPEVEVGIRHLIEQRLSMKSLFVFPQDNLLLLSTASLRREIGDEVYLQSLNIRKTLPQALTVTVKEKDPKLVVAAGGQLVITDGNGVLLRRLTEGETIRLGDLPPAIKELAVPGEDTVVFSTRSLEASMQPATTAGQPVKTAPNKNNDSKPETEIAVESRLSWPLVVLQEEGRNGLPDKKYAVGDNVLPTEAVTTVLVLQQSLPTVSGSQARWFVARPSGETVEANLAEGWVASFSTASEVNKQLSVLRILLTKDLSKRRDQLESVDLRYGEKVFATFKDEAAKEVKKPSNN